jgi:hypothetical protein
MSTLRVAIEHSAAGRSRVLAETSRSLRSCSDHDDGMLWHSAHLLPIKSSMPSTECDEGQPPAGTSSPMLRNVSQSSTA